MLFNQKFYVLIITICSIYSCNSIAQKEPKAIQHVVGEIFPNDKIDTTNFKICNSQNKIIQYYAFTDKTYEGEKITLTETFLKNYKPNSKYKDSGWIRIRFIINCNGEAGRFRASGMDMNYKQKSFHPYIIDQLMHITKSLKGWKPMEARGIKRDYYQYLLFKIQKGEILEILP